MRKQTSRGAYNTGGLGIAASGGPTPGPPEPAFPDDLDDALGIAGVPSTVLDRPCRVVQGTGTGSGGNGVYCASIDRVTHPEALARVVGAARGPSRRPGTVARHGRRRAVRLLVGSPPAIEVVDRVRGRRARRSCEASAGRTAGARYVLRICRGWAGDGVELAAPRRRHCKQQASPSGIVSSSAARGGRSLSKGK
ncbi:hypothetical protein AURDEDRAFT_175707 [Auricularia subglabra TFB-10046 SS5]|nr:hypothetical protein AURDEDRAFT_175707 [Auricularia subglabra TFB-10046 SS5]